MIRRLFAAAFATIACGAFAGNWTIDVGSRPAECKAASWLEEYLGKMSVKTIMIDGHENVVFHIGDTAFARQKGYLPDATKEESWSVASYDGDVVLTGGGPRGTFYAVAHFFEDECGVRRWSPVEEDVPVCEKLSLKKLNRNGAPFFPERNVYYAGGLKDSDFSAWNRLNGGDSVSALSPEIGGGVRMGRPRGCHSFEVYMPGEKYSKDHPEWFAYNKSTDKRDFGKWANLCLTNRELREEMKRLLRGYIKEDLEDSAKRGIPPPKCYDISENDTWRYCECDACTAAEKKWGHSGLLLDFVSDIASSIATDYPDIMVNTLSYHGSEPVPTGDVKAADNVIVRMCDTRSNQAIGREESGNLGFRNRLDGWAKHAKHFAIWDYLITYTPDIDGVPYASELHFADYYRMCRRYGVVSFFHEHENMYRTDAFELKFFMMTRLMENPDLDGEKLVRQFMNEYYGAAGECMLRYRKGLDEAIHRNKGNIFWFPTLEHWDWIKDEDIRAFQALFDEGERLVADDAKRLLRVRRMRYGLDRLVCLRNLRNPNPDKASVKASAERIGTTLNAWYAKFAKHFPKFSMGKAEDDRVSAVGLPPPKAFAGLEIRDFPSSLLYAADVDRDSVFVSDPESETKRALCIDADSSKHYDFPYCPGVYNREIKGVQKAGGQVTACYPAPLADGKYAWYRIGVATPTTDSFVYLSGTWLHSLNLKFHPEVYGKTYEFFVSVKFTGKKYQKGSTEPSKMWIDRVVMVPYKEKEWAEKAWKSVMKRFFLPKTSLLYDYRTGEGEEGLIGHLPTPEEIKAMKPCPTGWTAGMEDSVLNGTSLANAGILKWEKTCRNEVREDVRKLITGLLACAKVSGVPGFLARSISPVDGKSFFPDSSRDQYTQFVFTLWRFCRSDLSTFWDMKDLRKECVEQLKNVAAYAEKCVCEKNGWRLLRTDGERGYVSQMWTGTPDVLDDEESLRHSFGGISVHEALRLPMFYAAAYDVTKDPHWRELELRYADTGIRMANGSWAKEGKGFAIYQAQQSHRLLYETETDPARKAAYLALLKRYAKYAPDAREKCLEQTKKLGRNIYVYGTDWRKLPKQDKDYSDYGIPGWKTVPVWETDFDLAFEILREGSECMTNALLAGEPATAECEKTFESVFGRLDYDRVTSVAGVAQALFAHWMRETLPSSR